MMDRRTGRETWMIWSVVELAEREDAFATATRCYSEARRVSVEF